MMRWLRAIWRSRQADPIIEADRRVDAGDPKQRLWTRVSLLFLPEPDGHEHPGPDVEIARLPEVAVKRAWNQLRSAAAPEDLEKRYWHARLEAQVPLSDLEDPRDLGGEVVVFRGLRFSGVALPFIGVSFWLDDADPPTEKSSSISVYWWVGADEDWNAEKVAALVDLLDDLRHNASAAFAIEWVGWHVAAGEFVPAVDEYLSSEDVRRRGV